MDFISGIFIALATFLGFGLGEEVPDQPQPVEAEIVVEQEAQIDLDPIATSTENMQGETESGEEISTQTVDTESADYIPKLETMLVAGGCFWCVEADLEKTTGVIEAVSGYAGGRTQNPTYENYGQGGHQEVVEVTYDVDKISFEDILIVTMKTTDPTDDDGTFGDRGDKYSSAFYYEDEEQKQIIENLISEVDDKGPYDKPLAIDIEKRAKFWPAEDYHQDYYKGPFSKLKYQFYRSASGRDDLINKYWGVNDHSPELPWREEEELISNNNEKEYMWINYAKPTEEELKAQLDDVAYKVTQKDGTEKAGTSPLDKNWEAGIYVDILSGEPLYSSKDKFDSGTGWPSFTKPITPEAVSEQDDRKLFVTRTEIRSAIADNHLGHVFDDGPKDSTGLRYCMNGAALKFVPKEEMEAEGYGDFLKYVE